MGAHQADEHGLIVECSSCGQRNRVPFNAAETRCGLWRTSGARPAADIEAFVQQSSSVG